jgi:hypothetical protein
MAGSWRRAVIATYVGLFGFFAWAQEPEAPASGDGAPAEVAPAGGDAGEGSEASADGEGSGEGSEEGEEAGAKKDCPVPDVVRVGTFVNNVAALDLKTHSYEYDGYIWFKWCNPELDPATTMEFVNPSELWGMMVTPNYEEAEEFDDGTLYQVLRIQGRFSTKFPLYNYPFDRQHVGPVFEDSVHDAGTLVYALDEDGASINPELIMPGYTLGSPSMTVGEASYPTRFGDPRSAASSRFARATIAVPIARPLVAQLTLLMVPVLSVIVCATLMFILDPRYVDARVDVGITSMLTIVALQMTYNQDLPDVGYLMFMDKIYLLSYLFVLVGLAVVVRTTKLQDDGQPELAARMHFRGLFLASVAYLLIGAWLVVEAARLG